MSAYTPPVQALIDELGRLPGVGPKSAQRIALHLLKAQSADVQRLATAITVAKEKVRFCERCFNISDDVLCRICTETRRDGSMVCVVEEARDIIAIEKTGVFRGRYHVLLGAISPMDGIGPEQLKIRELVRRLGPENVTEIIVATNPTIEGDVTALYLARAFDSLNIKITRIGTGLPVGGDLEYADEMTLGRALEGRHELRE